MKATTVRSSFRLALAFAASGLAASAAPLSFDFKDPKGVNNVQFQLDAPLESITGTATGISGEVAFDPAAPEATRGRIILETRSLAVGNPVMGDHLRGEQWLDAARHPAIVFEALRVANVRTSGARIDAEVTGRLTVKGVTRELTVPVSFTYLPGKLGARVGDAQVQGDLLVLRARFAINRSEFDLQPGQMADKVAETIQLSLSIAGAAPRA